MVSRAGDTTVPSSSKEDMASSREDMASSQCTASKATASRGMDNSKVDMVDPQDSRGMEADTEADSR